MSHYFNVQSHEEIPILQKFRHFLVHIAEHSGEQIENVVFPDPSFDLVKTQIFNSGFFEITLCGFRGVKSR